MSTLRVRLPVPFDPAVPATWWIVDDAGRMIERGASPPSSWPATTRIEAAMGAADVRIVALALPPMSASRLPTAAAFALEDQLAAPAGAMHIAVEAPATRDAGTLARVVDRAAIAWLVARRPRIDRVVAEPDLVAHDGEWHWCIDADGRGFVRRPDGSAFAADALHGDALPPELVATLARPRRDATRVVVDADVDAARLAAWSQGTGAVFVPGTPWSPEIAPAGSWSGAPDLRSGYADDLDDARRPLARALVPALALVACAVALHIVATTAVWAHDRYAAWRADRAVLALARDAGIEAGTDARAAESLLARRAATAAHANARFADGDALPMIARMAGALAALPPGALRKLTATERRVVVDLAALDDAKLARLVDDLAQAGLVAISAPVAGGARVSATLSP